jgi:rod shape-determining protein MreD
MGIRSGTFRLIVIAVVAFFMQVAIAPNLAIAGVVADVMLCFVVALSMRVSQLSAVICGFLLGALTDLAMGSALGVRAFTYGIVAFAMNPIASMSVLDQAISRFIAMAVMLFAGELLMALVTSVIGAYSDLGQLMLGGVLPGGLYDSVVAVFFVPFSRGFRGARGAVAPGRLGGNSRSSTSLKEKLPPL